MTHAIPLVHGAVVWAELDPTIGREQGRRRPAVVISTRRYLESVTELAVVLPVTGVDRGWPNHVELRGAPGLRRPSWAMTEQPRTLARSRLHAVAGIVDRATLDEISEWTRDFFVVP